MSFRSETAFASTGKRFGEYLRDKGESAYFWTFTASEKHPDWFYAYMWKSFVREIGARFRYDYPGLHGIKTIQRHRKGGLHWHCIINKRVDVNWARRVGAKYGIGRIMRVEQVRNLKGALDYTKRYIGREAIKGQGCRLQSWGTIGRAPYAVRVRDIVVENDNTRFISRLRSEYFGGPVPNWLCLDVCRSMHGGYREREDFIMFKPREARDAGKVPTWEELSYPVWLIQREMDGVGERVLDGRLPF